VKAPEFRISVNEALEHPWIKNLPIHRMQIPKSLIKDKMMMMKNFNPPLIFIKFLAYYNANFVVNKEKRDSAFRLF
jgi:hypothetical protein